MSKTVYIPIDNQQSFKISVFDRSTNFLQSCIAAVPTFLKLKQKEKLYLRSNKKYLVCAVFNEMSIKHSLQITVLCFSFYLN